LREKKCGHVCTLLNSDNYQIINLWSIW